MRDTAKALEEPPLLRLALALLLDLFQITRGDGDVLDPLILGLVTTASVAPIRGDPGLERAYATIEAAPPDELRRPVSVSAIARSLRLPFETARRRVSHLVETGLLEMTPRGVVQTAQAGMHPTYVAQSMGRYERVKQAYFDAMACGALPPHAEHSQAATDAGIDGPPVRIVNRVAADLMLRTVDDLVTQVEDKVSALILLQIARATLGDPGPVRAAAARPRATPVSALASLLNLPGETARRHCQALERNGQVQRVVGGLVATPEGLGRVRESFAESAVNLRRMFERLSHLGVLKWWDDEARGGGFAGASSPAR